jgi:histidine kinase
MEGYVEGMLDHVYEPTEEVLTAIAEEAARLQRLAGDLAELSRTEEGMLDLHRQRADLAALTAVCADRLRPQYLDKGIGLEVRAGPPLPVDVDPARITQVLTNLLGNALTYTPPGGHVEVTPALRENQAVVSVTDTGIGLTTEDLDLVFDRFYRVPGPTRPGGGSGIGLTIARGIARAHGGGVDATSPGPGAGSTFTLTLPIVGDVAPA